MSGEYKDFLEREVERLRAESAEWQRQAIYHNQKHGELQDEIRRVQKSPIVAYTLVDAQTGEQWKHSKRLVYDTLAGLKQGYSAFETEWVHNVGYVKAPKFPGRYKVVELRAVP